MKNRLRAYVRPWTTAGEHLLLDCGHHVGPLKRVDLADHLVGLNLDQMKEPIRHVIRQGISKIIQACVSHAVQRLANNKDLETA